MAFVSVPKDLTKVKNKVVLNLTKRQSNAATGMVLLMLPAFLFAMYEKDGLPLEKVLWNIISVKFLKPAVRRYEVENLYELPEGSDAPKGKKGGNRNGKKKKR